MRSRLIAYSVITLLGLALFAYGMSSIHPSRHGFNELFAVAIGLITAAVGVVGLLVVAIRARPPT
jgi:uncharacterized membrane protein